MNNRISQKIKSKFHFKKLLKWEDKGLEKELESNYVVFSGIAKLNYNYFTYLDNI